MEGSMTDTITQQQVQERREEGLVLRLSTISKVDDGPHVTWGEGVIDNEHLGRLKSNCCCIYTKPRVWDDPSTWEQDENETEHCRGHTLPPQIPKDGKDSDNNEAPKGEHSHGCC